MEFNKKTTYHIGKFKASKGGFGKDPVGKPLVVTGEQLIERYNSLTFDDYMDNFAYKDFKLADNISCATLDEESNEYRIIETRTVLKPLQTQNNPQNQLNSPMQDSGQSAFQKELHNDFKLTMAKQIEQLQEQVLDLVNSNEELRNAKHSAEEKAMIAESALREMTAKEKAATNRIKELTEHNKEVLEKLSTVNKYYDDKIAVLQDESTANISGLLDNPMVHTLMGIATQVATPFIANFADNMRLKQEKSRLELEMMKQKIDPNYKPQTPNIPEQKVPEAEYDMEI